MASTPAPFRPFPSWSAARAQLQERSVLSCFGFAVFVLAAFLAVSPARSDEITPSHVFQLASGVNQELLALLAADIQVPKNDPNEAPLTPRQPRHVYQMARTVFFKIQKLRFLNNLELAALPIPPTRDIEPKDVYSLVALCLSSLHDLRPAYGISAPLTEPGFVGGKTPTDVYGELRRASLALNSLGIPEIAPNDVMRVALTIVSDLQLLLRERGISDVFPIAPRSQDKAPEDVYRMGHRVLLRLKELADLKPDLSPPGGIVLPNDRKGTIVPGHVEERLNDVLAEVMSIKARMQIDEPTRMTRQQAGKTPSDVFGAVAAAEAMVARLLPWPM